MEIQKRILNIKREGQQFAVAYPSFKKLCDYQESIKGLDTNKDMKKIYEASRDFLNDLGLPKEVYDELEAYHIEQIMNAFNHKKK